MLEKTLTKHRKNVWDSVNFYPIYPGKKCQNTDEKTLHKHSKNTRKNTRKTLEKGLKKPQKTHIWFVTFFHLFFTILRPSVDIGAKREVCYWVRRDKHGSASG